MGRSESKQVVNQGTSQSAQDQGNAQATLASTNKDLGDYSKKLDSFMSFGRKTYGEGGDFAKDQNAIATQGAAAGSNAIKGDLAMRSMRTGENTAGYAPALGEAQRNAQRDMTGELANADATRLQNLTNVNQFGVQASSLPASVHAGLYGPSISGASGQLDAASGAARTPGFWDTFLPALVGGASSVASAGIKH